MYTRKLVLNVLVVSILLITMFGFAPTPAHAAPVCDTYATAYKPYVSNGVVYGKGRATCSTGASVYVRLVVQVYRNGVSRVNQTFYCYTPCTKTVNAGSASSGNYQTWVSAYTWDSSSGIGSTVLTIP
jgi:hypothetical protein